MLVEKSLKIFLLNIHYIYGSKYYGALCFLWSIIRYAINNFGIFVLVAIDPTYYSWV